MSADITWNLSDSNANHSSNLLEGRAATNWVASCEVDAFRPTAPACVSLQGQHTTTLSFLLYRHELHPSIFRTVWTTWEQILHCCSDLQSRGVSSLIMHTYE